MNMARAVKEALDSGGHLIIEAPTGVGKSLAYLLAIATRIDECDGRVVISTYTKTLQRQLIRKDIPFLTRFLGREIPHALCLGSRNYLCLRRLNRLGQHGLFDREEADSIQWLFEWAAGSENGILSEAGLPASLIERVSRQADMCAGSACSFSGACFWRTAKIREARSRILIVNHHLFFANMVSGEHALPDFECVVFDEAHQVESTASDFLGLRVSDRRVTALLDSLLSVDMKRGLVSRLRSLPESAKTAFSKLVQNCRAETSALTAGLFDRYGKSRASKLDHSVPFADSLARSLPALREALGGMSPDSEAEELEISAMAERVERLKGELECFQFQDMENHVYWVESSQDGFTLLATPVDLAPILREGLFENDRGVILTSATLSTGGGFEFIRERLGLDQAAEVLLGSPFDHEKNLLIYTPESVPDPRDRGYAPAVAREIEKLASLLRGRIMALFTSYAMMRATRELLVLEDMEILMQGDMESYILLENFRSAENAVLLGTGSFWQGIDIPGEALQCVVITRLPFAVPDSPVMEARFDLLRSRGMNPFNDFQVPSAILTFKQGVGRLLRTEEDYGVVAVLDRRILSMPYGSRFLESLPNAERTASAKKLRDFFMARGNGDRTASG